jgi:hypothetical protein
MLSTNGTCMNSLGVGGLGSYVSSTGRDGCTNGVVSIMHCFGIRAKCLFFGGEAISIYKIHK